MAGHHTHTIISIHKVACSALKLSRSDDWRGRGNWRLGVSSASCMEISNFGGSLVCNMVLIYSPHGTSAFGLSVGVWKDRVSVTGSVSVSTQNPGRQNLYRTDCHLKKKNNLDKIPQRVEMIGSSLVLCPIALKKGDRLSRLQAQ